MSNDLEFCPICGRNLKTTDMTSHHWTPKSQGGKSTHTFRICKMCHSVLHFLIPLEEVINYQTAESLNNNKEYSNYIAWVTLLKHNSQIKLKKIIKNYLNNHYK
jgi:5-methylcytosine-specific restriction endonuclease McrA